MRKTLHFIASLALSLVALTATAAPATVLKHSTGTLPVHAVKPAEPATASQAKGFVPQKMRTRPGVGQVANFKQTRSYARLAMSQAAADVQLPTLSGVMVDCMTWPQYKPMNGLYNLPKTQGGDFELLFREPNGPCVVIGDRLYEMQYIYFPDLELEYIRYTVFDTEDGSEIYYENFMTDPDWSLMPVDMDVDPKTGDVYAITYNRTFTGYQLSRMTFTDKSVKSTLVAELDRNLNWNSMAIDANGQIWAISKSYGVENNMYVCTGSTLNKINKTTGAVTRIGDTGMYPEYMSSAAIDRESGRMFWNVCPDENVSYLAELDLTTGKATTVLTFPGAEEIVGLYAPVAAAAATAPNKVTNLEANFEKGALTGTVSFTAPTTLYNGSAATGALTYTITANGSKVAEGATAFGENVVANVTVPESASYKITVTVSNEAGEGPTASTNLFIGHGVPVVPFVRAAYANGTMTVTWTAVDETIDGGYIDPTKVTYTVKRGETTVATNQSATTFTETIPQPDGFITFQYFVTANYEGKSSEAGESNVVGVGEIKPPYTQTFDNEESLAGWTIIDANNDLRRWMWSTWENLRISFNQANAMDDWAITPAIRMEMGKAYILSFDVYGDTNTSTETIEVKMGNAPTAAALTTTIVAPTTIQNTPETPRTIQATIIPTMSGIYYLGFHGISEADQYMLNLDNVVIGSPIDSGAPAGVSDLTVKADPEGAYKATITFTTPDKSVAGGVIFQDFKNVEVLRDGEKVKEFSASPKQTLTYEDVLTEAGTYTYTVVCTNQYGAGVPVSVSVYVGTNIPAKPSTASVFETTTEGEVTVSWTAVTTDIYGKTIPASKVSYIVAENTGTQWKPVKSDLTGTSYTFSAAKDEQDMVQYAVFAVTEGGVGEGAVTQMIPVGPAYTSLHESFVNGYVTTLWAPRSIQGAVFSVMNDTGTYVAQDGDNGFVGMSGENFEDSGALASGKISLAGMTNPALSFYTYNYIKNNANTIAVGIKVIGDKDFTTVETLTVENVCKPNEWGRVIIPLTAYAGKTIQIEFLCTIKLYPYVFLDNITVDSMKEHDLAITALNVPIKATTGRPYSVNVIVSNEGTADAGAYSVDLFANEVKVDSKSFDGLESGQLESVIFERYMSPLADSPIEYSATVSFAGDENLSNNASRFAEVEPNPSRLPVPENLHIAMDGTTGTRLTWQSPDFEKLVAEEVTDDIEDAEPFAHSLEGWTFVDVDGSALGGFDNVSDGTTVPLPGITGGVTTGSFFVFDSSLPQFDKSFNALSGDKFIAAMFRADDGVTDDWMISPELDGSAQTISFFAKSFSAAYPEHLQILYSTGSLLLNQFEALHGLTQVPSDWAQFSITLPAGAKRFAIRSSSEASMMLMIDDITFTPSVASNNYKISGYHVYREGGKLTETPVESVEYADSEGNADHTYVVTALYDGKGESGPSRAAQYSGLEDVVIDFEVTVADQAIVVSGTENAHVSVYGLDGVTLYSGHGDATISVASGVYLVAVDKAVVKVIVK